MVYVQMGRKYYVIEINFDQQGSFDPLEGTMRMSQAKDAFILSPSSLLIRYSRAKTQNIESAFNKPRRKHIRKLWLVYYALTGHIPTIHTVRYGLSDKIDQHDVSKLALPTATTRDEEGFISPQTAKTLYQQQYLLTSVSYLYASHNRVTDEMGRLRLLWSAFNALYREFKKPEQRRSQPRQKRPQNSSEWEHACTLIEKLNKRKLLNDIIGRFCSNMPNIDTDPWRWKAFLSSFRPLGVEAKKGKSKLRNNEAAKRIFKDVDRKLLKTLSNRTSEIKNWQTLSSEDDPIKQKLDVPPDKPDSPPDECGYGRFRFVFSCYLYWLRCDTMHGNSPYPVFVNDDENDLLKTLCDFLEELLHIAIKYFGDTE